MAKRSYPTKAADTWTCELCFHKGRGADARAKHNQEKHSDILKRGWQNKGLGQKKSGWLYYRDNTFKKQEDE